MSPLAVAGITARRPSPNLSKHDVTFLLNSASAPAPPPAKRAGRPKRYPCPQCGHVFSQTSDLRKHQGTVHEGRKPYVCDVCHKSFGERGNMMKHKKAVHLNERPFQCTMCSATFCFKDGIQRHIKVSWIAVRGCFDLDCVLFLTPFFFAACARQSAAVCVPQLWRGLQAGGTAAPS